jgi:hypothetical protein
MKIDKIIFLILFISIFNLSEIKAKNDTLKAQLKNFKLVSQNDSIKMSGDIKIVSPNKEDIQKVNENDWLTYIIPILMGLFAGLIALRQVKLNNITVAKIDWVEKFRDTLSNYLMNIDSSSVHLSNLKHFKEKEKDNEKKSAQYYEHYEKYSLCTDLATQHFFKLKLLFYKNNKESKDLEILINELDILYGEVKCQDDIDKLREKITICINISQNLLRKEWTLIETRNWKHIFK